MRLRFAPSPTGFLHIGGARTALYNWLLARKSSENRRVLRLEDTDRERSTDEAVAQILEALDWLELDWDDGPIRQTERSERYSERLEQLLDSGEAYLCRGRSFFVGPPPVGQRRAGRLEQGHQGRSGEGAEPAEGLCHLARERPRTVFAVD